MDNVKYLNQHILVNIYIGHLIESNYRCKRRALAYKMADAFETIMFSTLVCFTRPCVSTDKSLCTLMLIMEWSRANVCNSP